MMTDDELNQLLAPSHQPYEGPTYDLSPIGRELSITGQLNPISERQFALEHGRYPASLGAATMSNQVTERVIERQEHGEVFDLEAQDDVLGSGIFDPSNRPGTSNTNMGVFASHYSLPGYHARERPFTVNTEVADITDGAAVVGVPSGGMAYVESRGHLIGPYPSPQPPSPGLRPGDPTTLYEPYIHMGQRPQPGSVDELLQCADQPFMAPGVPIGWPSGLPREPMFDVAETPMWPSRGRVPHVPHGHRVPTTSTVYPHHRGEPIGPHRGFAPTPGMVPATAQMQPAPSFTPRHPAAMRHPMMAQVPMLPASAQAQPQFQPQQMRQLAHARPSVLPTLGPQTAGAQTQAHLQVQRRPPVGVPMHGFGADAPAATPWGTYAAYLGAGVMAGLAVRMLLGASGKAF